LSVAHGMRMGKGGGTSGPRTAMFHGAAPRGRETQVRASNVRLAWPMRERGKTDCSHGRLKLQTLAVLFFFFTQAASKRRLIFVNISLDNNNTFSTATQENAGL
jgi:hypothetical protein